MNKEHFYKATITWTGSREGTTGYKNYERSHLIEIKGKPKIEASSDIPFMGDGSKLNPEDLFLASLSSCHMLWYLHLCADAGIVVTSYVDKATGVMLQEKGKGRFINVTLHPEIFITDSSKKELAIQLHDEANKNCFIANSCNFPIDHKPVINY